MKKIIAIILALLTLASLASCSLIRKATEQAAAPDTVETEKTPDTSPDTEEAEPAKEGPKRYTEEEAYEILRRSITDYDVNELKFERTGAVIAENDGTEYYIFKVDIPKSHDTTKEGESAKPEYDSVFYYVSVNGTVHTALYDGNKDTLYAQNAFNTKYGKENPETKRPYKLEYEGIMKSGDVFCYKFAVYETEEKNGAQNDVFVFNYLVTIDGGFSAEINRAS